MSAGMRRLATSRRDQRVDSGPGPTGLIDATVEVSGDLSALVVEVVVDEPAPVVEVVEPVVVGADALEVNLDDLVDVDVPDDLPAGVPLVLERTGERYRVVSASEDAQHGVGYPHRQLVPATLWQIQHGMGFDPGGITVLDSEGVPTEFDSITYPMPGVLELRFGAPVSGMAYVS